MSYNRKNLLLKIIDIQSIYQEKKLPESTHVGVWREHIYPVYKISLRTLDTYLQIPANKELKKILENEQKNKAMPKQTTMEFTE